MTQHDLSPDSGVCTACGAYVSPSTGMWSRGHTAECHPSAAEPDDAWRVLREFMRVIAPAQFNS